MADARSRDKSLKDILESGTFRIGMTATLGVLIGIAVVTCLVIFGDGVNASPITNVGKLLIDTDAGADDAIAILLALNADSKDETEVVGITCVNGNTYVDNVVLNVLKTLKVVNRLDIPVYKGADRPLLMYYQNTNFFGKDGFGDFNYPDPPSTDVLQEDHAVHAMIKLVKTNPGKVTLLALGPLTNVALAVRTYSSFLEDLQQLIILGGSSEGVGNVRPGMEFNFAVDPAANYIVFNSSTSKPVTLIPLETTIRSKLAMEFRTSFKNTDNRKLWLINSAESVTLKPDDEFWNCADAVAASVALSSGRIITESKTVHLDASYEGSITAGTIMIDYTNITQQVSNVNLIQRIDVESYKSMITDLFS